jgi:hypothetical protein
MILAGVTASSPGRCAVASRGLTRSLQPRGGGYEEDGEVQSVQVKAPACNVTPRTWPSRGRRGESGETGSRRMPR